MRQSESAALAVIREWQEKYKNSPSPSELQRAVARSSSGIRYILWNLQKKGYIDLVFVGHRFLIVPLFWE